MEKTYKPSGKFSPAGAIILFLVTAVAGSVLSFIYLKLVSWIPFVYLNILLAAGFGLLIGLLAKLIIRSFKIRNIAVVLIAVLLGGLLFTYVKWSIYDYNDGIKITDDLCKSFRCDEDELPDYLKLVKNTHANEVNMSKSDFNYLQEYCKNVPEPGRTFTDVLFSPSTLFHDIKYINKYGRWTYSSSSYSNKNTNKTTVKGTVLGIVWIAEIAIILGVAIVMSIKYVKEPFIESDNELAKKYDEKFYFQATNAISLKRDILANPESLFDVPALEFAPPVMDYITGELYHSSDFRECYLSLSLTSPKQKGKNKQSSNQQIISYLDISGNMTDKLFYHCHKETPYVSDYVPESMPDYAQTTSSSQPASNSTYVNPDEFFK